MQRLHRKKATIAAARPEHSVWAVEEAVRLVPWFKSQYINDRPALLDDFNGTMIKELEPILDRALRYLDIPFHKQWYGTDILQYNFWLINQKT